MPLVHHNHHKPSVRESNPYLTVRSGVLYPIELTEDGTPGGIRTRNNEIRRLAPIPIGSREHAAPAGRFELPFLPSEGSALSSRLYRCGIISDVTRIGIEHRQEILFFPQFDIVFVVFGLDDFGGIRHNDRQWHPESSVLLLRWCVIEGVLCRIQGGGVLCRGRTS